MEEFTNRLLLFREEKLWILNKKSIYRNFFKSLFVFLIIRVKNREKIGRRKDYMDAGKRERYEHISEELTKLVGGKDNIQGVAHCATRLSIVLKDNDRADLKAMEDVDLA